MTRPHWFRYASPHTFAPLAARLAPAFGVAALILIASGLAIGLAIAPTDALQGDIYRIMFVHVPAAWMSMFVYVVMAGYCALGLIFNTRLSAMMAQALAPCGAVFTLIALVTGALWGKPAWGAWWVWDARLTSELILLFLYLGFIALHAAIDDARRADRACAVLALVGVVNIPIIYFSVQWWYTLHQGPSLGFGSGVAMTASMLAGIVVMTFGFWAYAIASTLMRVRAIIRARERAAPWQTRLEEQAA
ncbi:heme ABC transporter permease CcmC [Paraburkholderia adhaesiva]|uniref:heme ABC transporter permease CcmC n=1 Tax=Paraburkholderia adhaesiva TaxID=2883244 RepID=UPI001F28243A|nr:heme ABC transporter permease CcmC [Paraburkholderia adhaesiva]